MQDQPWMRWRTGERVCVVCGSAPVASVRCPPPWLPPIGLASWERPWRVPVCGRHGDVALWPMKTLLAIADQHRGVAEEQPGPSARWTEALCGTRVDVRHRLRSAGPRG